MSVAADTPPAPGEIVRVRSRRYLVEAVDPVRVPEDQTLVHLSCLEDDAEGEELSVLDVAWNRTYPADGRSADQHDAWVVAEWMRTADANGALSSALRPALDVDDRKLAEIEAWILGVG